MINLRPLVNADIAVIENWPAYPPEFEELNYALRSNGWLAEFHGKPDTWIYIAEQAGEVVAFSIISSTSPAEAEFRIAMHPSKIGLGLGKTITSMTLERGFSETALTRIHLIVRRNNQRAIGLYRAVGFKEYGHCVKSVNGKLVNFLQMDISRST